jgi:hypothetical protein
MMKYAYPFQNEVFFASDAGQELIGRNFGITQKKRGFGEQGIILYFGYFDHLLLPCLMNNNTKTLI